MSTKLTVFQISTKAGVELIRVDEDGNFFVRGEEVASTSIIRDAFLDYAKIYASEHALTKTLVAIKSTVPAVLAHYTTDEERAGADFAIAMLRAQTTPEVVMQYDGGEMHIHVLVGMLAEMQQELLRQKREYEQNQAALYEQLKAQSAAMAQESPLQENPAPADPEVAAALQAQLDAAATPLTDGVQPQADPTQAPTSGVTDPSSATSTTTIDEAATDPTNPTTEAGTSPTEPATPPSTTATSAVVESQSTNVDVSTVLPPLAPSASDTPPTSSLTSNNDVCPS